MAKALAKEKMKSQIKKIVHMFGNEKVDEHFKFIIEQKLPCINNSKIKFDYNVAKTYNSNNINNDDLDKLLENLLDNAIEACEKITDEKSRWIEINIYEEENRFLYIDVINSNNHPNTKSENDEKRGYGFECLKTFLRKYNGDLFSYGHYVDRFSVEMQIPMHNQMAEISLDVSKKYMFKGIHLYNCLKNESNIRHF